MTALYPSYREPKGWWRHLSLRQSVARKDHACLRCPELIRAGVKYTRSVDILDGEFHVSHFHISCYLKFMGGAS